MRNSPRARFLARLRKATWLLPPAAATGVAVLMRADVRAAIAAFVPVNAAFMAVMNSEIEILGLILLTIFCSARLAVRITKAKKLSQRAVVMVTLVLGVVLFFGYYFAEMAILKAIARL